MKKTRSPGRSRSRSIGRLRRAFAPWFVLDRVAALGCLVPPPCADSLAQRHPRLIDRLETRGLRTRIIEDQNHHAFRLITLYRERPAGAQPQPTRTMSLLAQLGFVGAAMPSKVTGALDFLGQAAAAESKKWSKLALIIGLVWYGIWLACCVFGGLGMLGLGATTA